MAVAVDTATSTRPSGNATTVGWSHTCTGTDLVLVVFITGNQTVSGVTYNSVAMTKLDERIQTSFYQSAWVLANPDTGSHTITATFAGSSGYRGGTAVSLAGCKTSASVGSSYYNSGVNWTTANNNITVGSTTAGSCLIDGFAMENAGSLNAPNAGQTQQVLASMVDGGELGCSTKILSSGGNNTSGWALNSSGAGIKQIVEILALPSTGNPAFLLNFV